MGVVSVVLRVVAAVFGVIALIMVLRIVLAIAGANVDNGLVQLVVDLSDAFLGPFEELFTFTNDEGMPEFKKQIAANYGLAALFYLVLAGITSAISRRLKV